jgi:MFS transporter, DHA2 family, methylenomycin A resistance protein
VSPARVGALAVLALVALDVAAVPAVLPSVRLDLGTSTSGLVWIQDSYLLALTLALVLLGPLGGAADPRLLAAAGLVAFVMGALLASVADSTATVVAGRTLQGAGSAALLLPAFAALEGATARQRAMLAAAGLAVLAAAPLLGGAVAEKADWRWLFRLELAPATLAALVLAAPAAAAPQRALRRPAALAAGSLLAAIGLIQAGPWGWASADTLLLLAAGAALLAVAWSDLPRGMDAVAPVLAATLAAMLLFAPQYFELVRGLSPLRSGLLSVALTGSAAVLAVAAAVVMRRPGVRAVLVAGLTGAAVGALVATRIDPASSYAVIVASLALLGAGAGSAAGALLRGGRGVGLLPGTAAATALIVAAAGAVFERAQLGERESGGSFEDALAAGLVGSAWLLAALLAAGAVLVWRRRG